MSVVHGQDGGDSDQILPWYRTLIEREYLDGVSKGYVRPVVLVLDPLFEPSRSIAAEMLGEQFAETARAASRTGDIPSMLVGAVPQDLARQLLGTQGGADRIIAAIVATGDFAVFILDGNGPRWYNVPIPVQ